MQKRRLAEGVRLSEAQFREVIRRASQTSDSPGGISIGQLREIAAELDINPEVLERSLHSALTIPPSIQQRPGIFRRELTRIAHFLDHTLPGQRAEIAFIAGGALGWWSASTAVALHQTINGVRSSSGSSASTDIPIALILIALTLANSLSRRLEGRYLRFFVETVAIWGGFGLSWALTYGRMTDDLAMFIGTSLVAATVLGWFIVRPKVDNFNVSGELTPVP